jgi:23S rRNA G2445 N2-methylase RlmL
MKAICWTHPGLEKIAAEEIQQRISIKHVIQGQFISCESDLRNLCKLCYEAQSLRGIIISLGTLDLDDLDKTMEDIDFSNWLSPDIPFAVRLHKFNIDIDTQEIEGTIGAHVNRVAEAPVDLDQPKVTVAVLASKDVCHIGIDLAGIDLGKREYKIFSRPASLKGSLAFCMLKLAGFERDKVLVDPFAKDGVVGIEAALLTMNRSPHFFQKERLAFTKLELPFDLEEHWKKWDSKEPDSSAIHCLDSLFHNVQALRKNSKVAGVDKYMKVSRVELDWLDTKFKEETVDCIVTYPPELSQHSDKSLVMKLYNELFHQANFVLDEKGTMVLALRNPDVLKKVDMKNLKQKELIEAWQGKQIMHLALFEKA